MRDHLLVRFAGVEGAIAAVRDIRHATIRDERIQRYQTGTMGVCFIDTLALADENLAPLLYRRSFNAGLSRQRWSSIVDVMIAILLLSTAGSPCTATCRVLVTSVIANVSSARNRSYDMLPTFAFSRACVSRLASCNTDCGGSFVPSIRPCRSRRLRTSLTSRVSTIFFRNVAYALQHTTHIQNQSPIQSQHLTSRTQFSFRL